MSSSKRMNSCVLAAFAVVVILSSCSAESSTNAAGKTSKERKAAPEFTLTDANGSSVKLSDYRGKVVLLNFWATWCGPCTLEIPWFIDFEQEFKSRGFEVVGISMDDDGWAAIKPYVAEHKMNYRVLLGNDSVSQLYGGVEALPTTFIIDRDGKIASVHVGLAGKDEYSNEIQSLLGQKQVGLSRGSIYSWPAALFVSPAK
ncbi:MAG: peroxiredoxin family protein [Bryobacteraceae bacterium]